MVGVCLTLYETAKLFSKVAVSLAMYESSCCSTSSSALGNIVRYKKIFLAILTGL